jgi:uncharacterized coiled-coil protein SlyX
MPLLFGWIGNLIGKFWPYILIATLLGLVVGAGYFYYTDSEAAKAELNRQVAELTTKTAIQDATINTLKEQQALIKQINDDHNIRMAAAAKNLEDLAKKFNAIDLSKLVNGNSKLAEKIANDNTTQLLQAIKDQTSRDKFSITPKPGVKP